MRIAVNTRLLLTGRMEGIGQFATETLKRITTKHPEHEFIFFFDRPWDDAFLFSDNITPVVLNPQARHPFLFYLFFEWALPAALKKYRADLFLSPDGWLSLSTDVKSVNVIHDLNFEHHPEHIRWLVRKYYRHFFPRFARKATRLATVSEFSKNDIASLYNIPSGKIDVVYNGVSELFKPSTPQKITITRNRISGGKPYFMFIGLIHARKNIANLMCAFDRFREETGQTFALLLAGQKKWWDREMEETYQNMKHRNDVIFTGRIPTEEVSELMAASAGLVYVPFFEGFGIPILEAMNCKVPVITSAVTSMPEVAGDAALYADPHDFFSISNAMVKLAHDPILCESLIVKGSIQAARFSWDVTAGKLWETIEKAMA